jgi:hypothetical protein
MGSRAVAGDPTGYSPIPPSATSRYVGGICLPVHNLMERENDLIGNFIGQFRTVPEYQIQHGM